MSTEAEKWQKWEKVVVNDLKSRIIDDLQDEEHVPNTLGNLEVFLRRQIDVIEEKKRQLESLRSPLP